VAIIPHTLQVFKNWMRKFANEGKLVCEILARQGNKRSLLQF